MATFTIKQDNLAESPRDWDNLGTMVCAHGRYRLGDENAKFELRELIESHPNFREKYYDDYRMDHLPDLEELGIKIGLFTVILPVYLYDHSGLTISTTPFSCPWDSGKLGFIYATKEDIRNEYSNVKNITKSVKEIVSERLKGEVETYDQFLTGDIYYFDLSDTEEYEDEHSCGGFYGSDVETNGMLDHIDEKYHDLARSATHEYA